MTTSGTAVMATASTSSGADRRIAPGCGRAATTARYAARRTAMKRHVRLRWLRLRGAGAGRLAGRPTLPGALVSVAALQSADHDRNELRGRFCRAAFPALESGSMHTLAKFVVTYARGRRVELCDLLVVDGVDGVGPVLDCLRD
jgi:hypothetical protein